MNSVATTDLDAVKMMREIRDELSRELQGMSHSEQERFLKEQLEPSADNRSRESSRRHSSG